MGGLDLTIPISRTYKAPFQGANENKESMLNQVAITSFKIASYLTEIPCTFHKYSRLGQVVEEIYPTASKAEISAR